MTLDSQSSPTSPAWHALTRRPIWAAILLLLTTVLFYVPGVTDFPLMDRDEPRFARATVEMMERSSWDVPYFNSDPNVEGKNYRFDKPPLTYWLMAAAYGAGGVSEFTARVHSILAVWLTAWLIYLFGRALHPGQQEKGNLNGFLAALAWLVSAQVLVHGRLSVADMPMILCVTWSALSIWKLLFLETRHQKTWFVCLVVSLSLGFLAKGPIAWIVPFLGLVLTRWLFLKKPIPWKHLRLPWLIPFVFLGIAWWGLPANLKTQWAFFQTGIGEHIVERSTKVFNGRIAIPFYYLFTGPISLLPWGFVLWAAVRKNEEEKSMDDQKISAIAEKRRAFLLGWFLAPIIVFSLIATQLPHYILPGFPAFFLLLFRTGHLPKLEGKWDRAIAAFLTCCLLIAIAIACWGALSLESVHPGWTWFLAALASLLAWMLLGGFLLRRQKSRPAWWVFWGAGVALIFYSITIPLGWLQPTRETLAELRYSLGKQDKKILLGALDYEEPSLVFYHGEQVKFFRGKWDRAEKWWNEWRQEDRELRLKGEKNPESILLLVREQEWTLPELIQRVRKNGFASLDGKPSLDESERIKQIFGEFYGKSTVIETYNPARSSWMKIRVLRVE